MWQLLDFIECSIRAALLLYLCNGAIRLKEKYKKQGKFLFFLLFVIWGFWLGNSKWLKRLLYGESMDVQKSSTTIAKLFLMLFFCFFLLVFFYEGSRLLKAYLVLLYEAILELARFGVHGFWSLAINAYSDWQINRVLEEKVPVQEYMDHMQMLGYAWNVTLMLLYFSITYLTIRTILKYQKDMRYIDRQGILFLMLSPAVGIAFDVILRCLFFTWTGTEYDFLYDRHRGMYTIIPIMTFLCLLSIIYSTKIYEELMRAQEEKNRMFFYRQQLSDMTKHVQDMERLYDGIRGMRHDMNNYIADMEQLLLAGMQKEKIEAFAESKTREYPVEAEARQYLERMKTSLDALTMRCNTGNPVTDVIINRKWQECEKEKITFMSDFLYPEQLGIEAFDLGILMNNALDNAIEACKKCVGKQSLHIQVHSYQKGRMFFLRIENDCKADAMLYTEEKTLRTTKEDEWMHGIGLKNMESVTKRYFGTMSYTICDEVFVLTIMLQGKQAPY